LPGRDAVRLLIGRDVDVDERDGVRHHGRLLNANRRSLWLLDGDEDHFIPLVDVTDLRAAS
jgi:hypothetical protein